MSDTTYRGQKITPMGKYSNVPVGDFQGFRFLRPQYNHSRFPHNRRPISDNWSRRSNGRGSNEHHCSSNFQPRTVYRGNFKFYPNGRGRAVHPYGTPFQFPGHFRLSGPSPFSRSTQSNNELKEQEGRTKIQSAESSPRPPLLGSEEERQQKITETAVRLKQTLSSVTEEDINEFWQDDLSVLIPDNIKEKDNVIKPISELRYEPPDLDLTFDDLKVIGGVDVNNSGSRKTNDVVVLKIVNNSLENTATRVECDVNQDMILIPTEETVHNDKSVNGSDNVPSENTSQKDHLQEIQNGTSYVTSLQDSNLEADCKITDTLTTLCTTADNNNEEAGSLQKNISNSSSINNEDFSKTNNDRSPNKLNKDLKLDKKCNLDIKQSLLNQNDYQTTGGNSLSRCIPQITDQRHYQDSASHEMNTFSMEKIWVQQRYNSTSDNPPLSPSSYNSSGSLSYTNFPSMAVHQQDSVTQIQIPGFNPWEPPPPISNSIVHEKARPTCSNQHNMPPLSPAFDSFNSFISNEIQTVDLDTASTTSTFSTLSQKNRTRPQDFSSRMLNQAEDPKQHNIANKIALENTQKVMQFVNQDDKVTDVNNSSYESSLSTENNISTSLNSKPDKYSGRNVAEYKEKETRGDIKSVQNESQTNRSTSSKNKSLLKDDESFVRGSSSKREPIRPKVTFNVHSKSRKIYENERWQNGANNGRSYTHIEHHSRYKYKKKDFTHTRVYTSPKKNDLHEHKNNILNSAELKSKKDCNVDKEKRIQSPVTIQKIQDATKWKKRNEHSSGTSWKDKVINRFLRMSKNDIRNMVNSSSLRKFDIAMKQLVKEKRSSLSLETRNIATEKTKDYNSEEFMYQLNAMLDPSATVDISNLPTEFIHHLNEVLQLDVAPFESDEMINQFSNENQMVNLDTFDIQCINEEELLNDVNVHTDNGFRNNSQDTIREDITCVNVEAASNEDQTLQNRDIEKSDDKNCNHSLNDIHLEGNVSLATIDNIFSTTIMKERNQGKDPVTEISPKFNEVTNIQPMTPIANVASKSVLEKDYISKIDKYEKRFRKEEETPDAFRNLTKEEWEAKYGKQDEESVSDLNKMKNSSLKNSSTKCLNLSIRNTDDVNLERLLKEQNNSSSSYDRNSNSEAISTSETNTSSSSSSGSENEIPSDMSKLLKVIKENERMVKKKSLNETIREEVTAEIQRKWKDKSKYKERKYRQKDKRRREKRTKWKKERKKKRRKIDKTTNSSFNSDKVNHFELFSEHEIKKERIVEENSDVTPETNTILDSIVLNDNNQQVCDLTIELKNPQLSPKVITLSDTETKQISAIIQPKTKAQLKLMPETSRINEETEFTKNIATTVSVSTNRLKQTNKAMFPVREILECQQDEITNKTSLDISAVNDQLNEKQLNRENGSVAEIMLDNGAKQVSKTKVPCKKIDINMYKARTLQRRNELHEKLKRITNNPTKITESGLLTPLLQVTNNEIWNMKEFKNLKDVQKNGSNVFQNNEQKSVQLIQQEIKKKKEREQKETIEIQENENKTVNSSQLNTNKIEDFDHQNKQNSLSILTEENTQKSHKSAKEEQLSKKTSTDVAKFKHIRSEGNKELKLKKVNGEEKKIIKSAQQINDIAKNISVIEFSINTADTTPKDANTDIASIFSKLNEKKITSERRESEFSDQTKCEENILNKHEVNNLDKIHNAIIINEKLKDEANKINDISLLNTVNTVSDNRNIPKAVDSIISNSTDLASVFETTKNKNCKSEVSNDNTKKSQNMLNEKCTEETITDSMTLAAESNDEIKNKDLTKQSTAMLVIDTEAHSISLQNQWKSALDSKISATTRDSNITEIGSSVEKELHKKDYINSICTSTTDLIDTVLSPRSEDTSNQLTISEVSLNADKEFIDTSAIITSSNLSQTNEKESNTMNQIINKIRNSLPMEDSLSKRSPKMLQIPTKAALKESANVTLISSSSAKDSTKTDDTSIERINMSDEPITLCNVDGESNVFSTNEILQRKDNNNTKDLYKDTKCSQDVFVSSTSSSLSSVDRILDENTLSHSNLNNKNVVSRGNTPTLDKCSKLLKNPIVELEKLENLNGFSMVENHKTIENNCSKKVVTSTSLSKKWLCGKANKEEKVNSLHGVKRKRAMKNDLPTKEHTISDKRNKSPVHMSNNNIKEEIMARMIEIDVEIHRLMTEKMTLYQMLESSSFLSDKYISDINIRSENNIDTAENKSSLSNPLDNGEITASTLSQPVMQESISHTSSEDIHFSIKGKSLLKNKSTKRKQNALSYTSENEDLIAQLAESSVDSASKYRKKQKASEKQLKQVVLDVPEDEQCSHSSMNNKNIHDEEQLNMNEVVSSEQDKGVKPGNSDQINQKQTSSNICTEITSDNSIVLDKEEKYNVESSLVFKNTNERLEPLIYSDDSTWESTEFSKDKRQTTGLALLEETFKREMAESRKHKSNKRRKKKKELNSILRDEKTSEEEDIPLNVLYTKKLEQKRNMLKCFDESHKSVVSNNSSNTMQSEDIWKHAMGVINAVAEDRVADLYGDENKHIIKDTSMSLSCEANEKTKNLFSKNTIQTNVTSENNDESENITANLNAVSSNVTNIELRSNLQSVDSCNDSHNVKIDENPLTKEKHVENKISLYTSKEDSKIKETVEHDHISFSVTSIRNEEVDNTTMQEFPKKVTEISELTMKQKSNPEVNDDDTPQSKISLTKQTKRKKGNNKSASWKYLRSTEEKLNTKHIKSERKTSLSTVSKRNNSKDRKPIKNIELKISNQPSQSVTSEKCSNSESQASTFQWKGKQNTQLTIMNCTVKLVDILKSQDLSMFSDKFRVPANVVIPNTEMNHATFGKTRRKRLSKIALSDLEEPSSNSSSIHDISSNEDPPNEKLQKLPSFNKPDHECIILETTTNSVSKNNQPNLIIETLSKSKGPEIEIIEKVTPTLQSESLDQDVTSENNQPLRTQYTVHKGPILDIKVFNDSFLAASEDGIIYRYSQTSNGILNIYKGHHSAVTCLHVSKSHSNEHSKNLLYSGSLDGTLRCYNILTGASVNEPANVGSPIQCMDQAWGIIFIGTKSGHVTRFHIKSGVVKGDSIQFSDKSVLALKATNEGPRRVLIVASRSHPIVIKDAQTGLFLRTICGEKSYTVYSLMRDCNLIYCGTSSTSISVFDFITGEQIVQYNAGVGIVCMRLYYHLLFAGCYDGNIYVFDVQDRKLICSIPGPGNMLLSMEVINNKIIAGSKDKRLQMWQMPKQVEATLHRSI